MFKRLKDGAEKNKRQFDELVMKRVNINLVKVKKLGDKWKKTEKKRTTALMEKKKDKQAALRITEKMDSYVNAMEECEKQMVLLKKELERIQEGNNTIIDSLLTLTKKQYAKLISVPDGYKSVFLYKNDPIIAATQNDGPFTL